MHPGKSYNFFLNCKQCHNYAFTRSCLVNHGCDSNVIDSSFASQLRFVDVVCVEGLVHIFQLFIFTFLEMLMRSSCGHFELLKNASVLKDVNLFKKFSTISAIVLFTPG